MKLMRNKKTREMVAVKHVEREAGAGLSKNTEREIINHRKLVHESIIKFHEVTPPPPPPPPGLHQRLLDALGA